MKYHQLLVLIYVINCNAVNMIVRLNGDRIAPFKVKLPDDVCCRLSELPDGTEIRNGQMFQQLLELTKLDKDITKSCILKFDLNNVIQSQVAPDILSMVYTIICDKQSSYFVVKPLPKHEYKICAVLKPRFILFHWHKNKFDYEVINYQFETYEGMGDIWEKFTSINEFFTIIFKTYKSIHPDDLSLFKVCIFNNHKSEELRFNINEMPPVSVLQSLFVRLHNSLVFVDKQKSPTEGVVNIQKIIINHLKYVGITIDANNVPVHVYDDTGGTGHKTKQLRKKIAYVVFEQAINPQYEVESATNTKHLNEHLEHISWLKKLLSCLRYSQT